MPTTAPHPLKDWIPSRLVYGKDHVLCHWIYTGPTRLCDPFFSETIHKCMTLPENAKGYKCLSDLDALAELGTHIDHIHPTAFIFHVSRCGSTLVSQALGLSPANISVSEVPILDEILRLPLKGYPITDAALGELFTNAARFYGARKTGEEQYFFIKTDCWHLLFYDRLRALYPHVPFVIMYRNPAEVLESNRRHRGIQGAYGVIEPALFGFDSSIPETLMHPHNYIAAVLEKLYSGIIRIVAEDNNVLLLNYNTDDLSSMMQKIFAHTGITASAAQLAAIADRGRFHAKSPSAKFVEQNKGDRTHEQDRLQELYHIIASRTGQPQTTRR